jgi:hypothetical protein
MFPSHDQDVKRRLDHWSNFNAGGYARAKRLNKSELIERLIKKFLDEVDTNGEHLHDLTNNNLAAMLIRDMPDNTLRSLLVDFIQDNNRNRK